MSQQKQLVVLAVCLLGLVAMVSAQSFDWQRCQQKFQSSMQQCQSSMVQAAREFANSMQDVGQGAADTSAFNSDMNDIMSIWSGVMNQGTSFDASRFSNAYIQTISKSQSLMLTAFRMYSSMPQSSMTSYMKFAQSIFSAQSSMMTSVSSGCMPTFRRALESN